jgi:hypothetical protein
VNLFDMHMKYGDVVAGRNEALPRAPADRSSSAAEPASPQRKERAAGRSVGVS